MRVPGDAPDRAAEDAARTCPRPASDHSPLDPTDFAAQASARDPQAVYMWCAHGLLDSTLLAELSERRLGATATTRDWNTVGRLLELAG